MRALTSPKETSTLGRSQYIVDLVEVFIHFTLLILRADLISFVSFPLFYNKQNILYTLLATTTIQSSSIKNPSIFNTTLR